MTWRTSRFINFSFQAICGIGNLVQSWVQLEGRFQPILVRKLCQINESLIGYEREGREFESSWRTILVRSSPKC